MTQASNAASILATGFEIRPNELQGFESHVKGTYGWATEARAKMEIGRLVEAGASPDEFVFIKAEVPDYERSSLRPDEDHSLDKTEWESSREEQLTLAYEGEVPQNWITEVHGSQRALRSLIPVGDAGFGQFEESAHPRGPGGKFAEKPDQARETGRRRGKAWTEAPDRQRRSREAVSAHPAVSLFDEVVAREGIPTADQLVGALPQKARDAMKMAEDRLAAELPTNVVHRGADGKYTPERQALHTEMVRRVFTQKAIAAATPAEGQAPTVTFLGGRGGSGKSWLVGPDGPVDRTRAIYINPDDIKEALPEYQGWNAGLLHEESSDVASMMNEVAKRLKVSVVHDATMKTTANVRRQVEAYQAEGYEVAGYYMFASPKTAAERAVNRFMEVGRFVPPQYSLASLTNEATFDNLLPEFREWGVYTSNDGFPPRLVSQGRRAQDAGFAQFAESEHPRGSGGRFAEKPDAPVETRTAARPQWLTKAEPETAAKFQVHTNMSPARRRGLLVEMNAKMKTMSKDDPARRPTLAIISVMAYDNDKSRGDRAAYVFLDRGRGSELVAGAFMRSYAEDKTGDIKVVGSVVPGAGQAAVEGIMQSPEAKKLKEVTLDQRDFFEVGGEQSLKAEPPKAEPPKAEPPKAPEPDRARTIPTVGGDGKKEPIETALRTIPEVHLRTIVGSGFSIDSVKTISGGSEGWSIAGLATSMPGRGTDVLVAEKAAGRRVKDRVGTTIHELGHALDMALNKRPSTAVGNVAREEAKAMTAKERRIAEHFLQNRQELFAELYNFAHNPDQEKFGAFGLRAARIRELFPRSIAALGEQDYDKFKVR